MEKKKILLKIYRSRKIYLFFYLFILIIIGYIAHSYYVNNPVSERFLIISLIIIVLIIKITEIYRIRDWWAITDSSFIESKSILNRNVREIDFHTIADISLDQPFYKRIFGYGTVEIRKLLNETSIKIQNINKPEKFINILRDAIVKRTKNEKSLL